MMATSYARIPCHVELTRSEAESRVSSMTPILELKFNSDSEEYDTDLEDLPEISTLRKGPNKMANPGLDAAPLRLTPSPSPAEWDDPVAKKYVKCCRGAGIPIQAAIVGMLKERRLDLSHRPLTTHHLKALGIALLDNPHVEDINFESVGMTSDGVSYLADVMIHNSTIERANFAHNRINHHGAVAIGAILRYSTGLIHLNAAGNSFCEAGAKYLVHGIKTNSSIEFLDLGHNELGHKGAKLIGSALGENDTMKEIKLDWNHFRCAGAVSICKGLQNNTHLVRVDLSWNGFGYEGAVALKNLLITNKVMQELDVSNNRINWQGALIISDGLRVNSTLKTLKIGHNPLTTTGCQDLLEACSETKSGIYLLDLEGVLVIREFEFLAMAIKRFKVFSFKHGGLVNSHDVLGQRGETRLDPMQKVIKYMKEREIRPTELFRSFDKEVSSTITHNMLIKRLKGAGVQMQRFEYLELIRHIERQGDGGAAVNYKNLVRSVNEQIEKERNERILVREKQKRLEEYHRYLLNTDLPSVPEVFDDMNANRRLDSVLSARSSRERAETPQESARSGCSSARRVGVVATLVHSLLPSDAQPNARVMSMSRPLGSHAKEFGQGGSKKKKKKRKRKSGQKKKKEQQ